MGTPTWGAWISTRPTAWRDVDGRAAPAPRRGEGVYNIVQDGVDYSAGGYPQDAARGPARAPAYRRAVPPGRRSRHSHTPGLRSRPGAIVTTDTQPASYPLDGRRRAERKSTNSPKLLNSAPLSRRSSSMLLCPAPVIQKGLKRHSGRVARK